MFLSVITYIDAPVSVGSSLLYQKLSFFNSPMHWDIHIPVLD